jgi:threonine synthase
MGPRSNTSEAVRRAADDGAAYASHAYLPFNLPGYATAACEIAEQVGGAPGTVIAPAGQGGLLLGMARGFEALHHAGIIKNMPVLVGVQARACAPLWALLNYGRAGLAWVAEAETLAEGIRISFPLRGDVLLQTLNQHKGTILAVDEDAILPGRKALAGMGFYVEPTSAVVWNAMEQVSDQIPEPIVLVLTGSGLKWVGP